MKRKSWRTVVSVALEYGLPIIVFLAVTLVSFIVLLFVLADTPLHTGDDLPGPLFLSVTSVLALIVGVISFTILRKFILHRRSGLSVVKNVKSKSR
jgi:hypothetical protein